MNSAKWQLVLFTILITFIVNLPSTYNLTNKLIANPVKLQFVSVIGGGPTALGVFVHSLVAGLLMIAYLAAFQN
jgi:hypothetical protein